MQDEHSAIFSRTQAHRDFFAEPEPEIFSLELAIEHTRALGNRIFAKQILIVVPGHAIFSCPQCNKTVCEVCTQNLNFLCDVSNPDDPEFQFIASGLFVANLLSEHVCPEQVQ